jgi:FG-GAP-like repeat
VLSDCVPGFEVSTARRLKEVRTLAQQKPVRSYRLKYQTADGLSLLSQVTEVGNDGLTLPSVSFSYTRSATAMQAKNMTRAPANLPTVAGTDADLVDMNGDGFVDILHAAQGAHTVALNVSGQRFALPVPMANAPSVALSGGNVTLADMNGDGFVDLVAKEGNTADAFRYFEGDGKGAFRSGKSFSNAPNFSLSEANVRLVDIDKDGRVDALQVVGQNWYWYRNAGDGSWESGVTLSPPPGMSAIALEDARYKLVDVNGDRLVDIAFVRSGSLTWWPATAGESLASREA